MPWKMVTRNGKNMPLAEVVDSILNKKVSEAKESETTLPLVKTELFSICTRTVGPHIVKPEEFQIGKGKSYFCFQN